MSGCARAPRENIGAVWTIWTGWTIWTASAGTSEGVGRTRLCASGCMAGTPCATLWTGWTIWTVWTASAGTSEGVERTRSCASGSFRRKIFRPYSLRERFRGGGAHPVLCLGEHGGTPCATFPRGENTPALVPREAWRGRHALPFRGGGAHPVLCLGVHGRDAMRYLIYNSQFTVWESYWRLPRSRFMRSGPWRRPRMPCWAVGSS